MEISEGQGNSRQAKKNENACKFCEKFEKEVMELKEKLQAKTTTDKNDDSLKKDIEELKEMFTKQFESLKCEIQDLKKGHKKENESLKKQENINTSTKRKFEVLEASTTVSPSKKSRPETFINEALENNSDDVSSSQKKSKRLETNDNRILDTEIITPSDYKFEHGTVKKEVKEEESEETKIEITSEYEYTDERKFFVNTCVKRSHGSTEKNSSGATSKEPQPKKIAKKMKCSPELAAFIGKEVCRSHKEAFKLVLAYVKEHNL